jgi:hypothetical protein
MRDLLIIADETTGTQSPKDFNMDNPLQAEGAARGLSELGVCLNCDFCD